MANGTAIKEPTEEARARWSKVVATCEGERAKHEPGTSEYKAWDEAAVQAKKMLDLSVQERTLYWKREEVVAALKFEKDGMTSLWQKALATMPPSGEST